MILKRGLFLFFIISWGSSSGQAFWSKEELSKTLLEIEEQYSKRKQRLEKEEDPLLPPEIYKDFFMRQDVRNLFEWGDEIFLKAGKSESAEMDLLAIIHDRNCNQFPFDALLNSPEVKTKRLTERQRLAVKSKIAYFLNEIYYLFLQKNQLNAKPSEKRNDVKFLFEAEMKVLKEKMKNGIQNLNAALSILPHENAEDVRFGKSVLSRYYEKKYIRLWFHVLDLILLDEALMRNQNQERNSFEAELATVEPSVKELAFFSEIEEHAEQILKNTQAQQSLYCQACEKRRYLAMQRAAIQKSGWCVPFVKVVDDSLFNKNPNYAFGFLNFVRVVQDMVKDHDIFLGRPGQVLLQEMKKKMKTQFLSKVEKTEKHFKNKLSLLILDALKALEVKSAFIKEKFSQYSLDADPNNIELSHDFFVHFKDTKDFSLDSKGGILFTNKGRALESLMNISELKDAFLKERFFVFPMIFHQFIAIFEKNANFAWDLLSEWGVRVSFDSKERNSLRVAWSLLLLAEHFSDQNFFVLREQPALDPFFFRFYQKLALTDPLYEKQDTFNKALLIVEDEIQRLFKTLFQVSSLTAKASKEQKFKQYVMQAVQYTFDFFADGLIPPIPNFDNIDALIPAFQEEKIDEDIICGPFLVVLEQVKSMFSQNAKDWFQKKGQCVKDKRLSFRNAIITHLSVPEKAKQDSVKMSEISLVQHALEKLYPASFPILQEFSFLKNNPDADYRPQYFVRSEKNAFFLNKKGLTKLLTSLKIIKKLN